MVNDTLLYVKNPKDQDGTIKVITDAIFAGETEPYCSGEDWNSTRICVDPIRNGTRSRIIGVQLKVEVDWNCVASTGVMVDESGHIDIAKLKTKYAEMVDIAAREEVERIIRVCRARAAQAATDEIMALVRAFDLSGAIRPSSADGGKSFSVHFAKLSMAETKQIITALAEARGTGGVC